MTEQKPVPCPDTVTAYHEAGHAVVAHAMRMSLRKVSVAEVRSGLVVGCQYESAASTTEVERAVVAMAGAAAIELLFGFQDKGAKGDVCEFMLIKCQAEGNNVWPRGLSLEAVTERAKSILRESEPAVHALAADLLKRVVLTGQEAVSIIEGVLP